MKDFTKRLDFLLLTTAFFVTLIISSAIYLIYSSAVSIYKRHNVELAQAVAEEVFSDMYLLMSKGWTRREVLEFLRGVKETYAHMDFQVGIYRGEKVKELFGEIEEPPKDELVLDALRTGREFSAEWGTVLYYLYPLTAREECLRCHVNAKEGDVLGVIEVRQDIGDIVSSFKKRLLVLSLYILPIPLIGSGIVILTLNHRIGRALRRLNSRIDQLNSVSDLKEIKVKEVDFAFEEMNRIGKSIEKLTNRLREIAVDRDVMEFVFTLLEKTSVTSEAIRDWKDFFKGILTEVSKILNYNYFLIASKDKEGNIKVHLFWACTCYEKLLFRKRVEETKVERLKEVHTLPSKARVEFEHTPLGEVKMLESCDVEEIELRIRHLALREPSMDVSVGIGIRIDETRRETKEHVVEGLLTVFLNLYESIKAVREYTERLEYFATRDPLTGFYNQRIFWDLFNHEIEKARRHNYRVSLFLVDLDNFKFINDVYGHSFGDYVLKKVGQVIGNVFRKEDIIARYGGDEFAIVLPYTDGERAKRVANRLVEAFERFLIEAPDGKIIKVTASVGIAIFPDHAKEPKELFIIADSLLYKAKEAGKSKFFLPTEEDLVVSRQESVSRSFFILERAGEIEVIPYFQPILNLRTGKREGYEVLMRIEQEDRVVPASEFIYTAEKTACLPKLDVTLIERALRRVRGCEPLLFFNLSPRTLIMEDFLERIKDIAMRYGIKYENIVFEITERETVRNFEVLKKFGNQVKEAGFKLAVDDFGSGFASFTYIKLFPVDIVKIDGDFIKSLPTSETDRAFVTSTLIMTKTLGIKTVAEQVENERILREVREIGIDYAQGFYVGEPSPHVCEEG